MVQEKIQIGNMELDGRIIMPPIATYRCDDNGHVTDEVCEYYAARAANPNISLIITEHSYITLQGKAKKKQTSIADDECIPGLSRLVDAIHRGGAKAVSQINHAGAAALSEASGMKAVAASPVILPAAPAMGDTEVPQELDREQIGDIVKDFASAAARAKEAGYDGVEIHSAHAYLLNQFYSPLYLFRKCGSHPTNTMNRLRKYRDNIGENPVCNAVMRAFCAVVNDDVTKMTFRMATDEQARSILDDEDFDLWVQKKAEYVASTGDHYVERLK